MASVLISRKALNEAIRNDAPRYVPLWVYETIKNQPTVDAVEVVRCKDCKYGEVDDVDIPSQYLCHYDGESWNDENHFCSYGEKMDNKNIYYI